MSTIDTLYVSAIAGNADARAKLEMKADRVEEREYTILHTESQKGNTEHVRYIVKEFASKNLLVKLNKSSHNALFLAACAGFTEVADVLIDAARQYLPPSSFQAFVRQSDQDMNTALHAVAYSGNLAFVKLVVEADPGDRHHQNKDGETPLYIAAENGNNRIVKVICTTCTAPSLDGPDGSTALHAAIRNRNKANTEFRDIIRMLLDAAKRSCSPEIAPNESFEAFFNKTDKDGCTILELAVDGNHVDVVELILAEDPAYGNGNKKNHLMRLIYKAIEKEYSDIVKLLSKTYEAGITDEHNGVIALILAIKNRDKESVLRLLENATQLLSFAEDEGWTPLHYAVYHEFDSILDTIMKAQTNVIYKDMVSTPLHVAAQNGHTSTMIRLIKLLPVSSSMYTALNKDGQNILHLAAAKQNKEMIHVILECCPQRYKDEIVMQKDADGNTPLHLLISKGCFTPELIKHKRLDIKNNKSWTPQDMLYLEDNIIADQVQIKIAIEHIQTNKYKRIWRKFWQKSIEEKTDTSESIVLPSRQAKKDEEFKKAKKLLMDKKHGQRKKDLERYKQRTNTQIIVTALITTVTFTVGFTMPGGLHQSGEDDEGLVVLNKKTAFNAFMVSDALALLMSTSSLFFYFLESMNEDPHQVSKLNAASTVLNIVSVMAMMLTFIAGTYVVLSHSPALAITVCVIGSFFFLLIIVLLIKIVYDRQVKKNED